MIAAKEHVWAVIMAGGSGTRFWPVSRSARPKQLTRIVSEQTMIQATVARLQPFVPPERVLVITTAAIAEETRRQLPMLPPERIVAEPVGRDTAPCVALAAEIVEKLDPGATMILLPADQLIEPAARFQEILAAGVEAARHGGLVTYGITPRFPATGYGYIKVGEPAPGRDGIQVNRVERFVEKPDLARAEEYLADGGYRWNSGIFTWRTDVVLAELRRHCGWLTEALEPVGRAFGSGAFDQRLKQAYEPLKKISIDYALMERSEDIRVVTCDVSWDDVGSWDALYEHLEGDERGVRTRGEILQLDCADSLLVNEGGPLIAAVGLEGVTVVSTPDAILVVPKGRSQDVKRVVEELKARGAGGLL